MPDELKDIGITEHLGDRVDLEGLRFRDESGNAVSLSQYFHRGRPVLLSIVYYECPNLCTFVLNGMVKGLRNVPWTPGNQYELVSVTINPRDTAELAAKKKVAYLQSLGKPGADAGWHFLSADPVADARSGDQAHKLAEQVGFRYKYDEPTKQFAHGAALYVLTPEGKISRYLYGVEFLPKDLRLALLEASNGKIGTVVDRFLLFCFRYDPKTRKYSVYLTNLMQAGCGATVLIFGGYLLVFWYRQRRIPVPVLPGKGA